MGNTSSFATGGIIAIELDKNGIVIPGETLNGKVYLEIFKDSISADYLDVIITGKEHTKVSYNKSIESDGKSRNETHYAFEEHVFFSKNCNLFQFQNGGKVIKGRYEYPFSITIPFGLPGRQGEITGSEYFAIRYYLDVRLHRSGFMTWDIKNNREILMTDPPFDYIKTPAYIEPDTQKVTFLCCFNTGTMTLGARTDTCDILGGDKLHVDYVIHNESTSRVKALEVRLEESVYQSAQGHSSWKNNNIFQTRIEANQLEDISPVSNNNQSQLNSLNIPILKKVLEQKLHEIKIEIPSGIRSSYEGLIGKCIHVLHIQLMTPMCTQNPEITIHIRAHNNPAPGNMREMKASIETEFQKPAGWNAISEKFVNLDNITTNPSAPPFEHLVDDKKSIEGLKRMLQDSNQWNETYALQDWISFGGRIDEFNAFNLNEIYRLIRSDYSYVIFSETIGKALDGKITCSQICGAASGSRSNENKIDILNSFASRCKDKENAQRTFETLDLPNFTYSCVISRYSCS